MRLLLIAAFDMIKNRLQNAARYGILNTIERHSSDDVIIFYCTEAKIIYVA